MTDLRIPMNELLSKQDTHLRTSDDRLQLAQLDGFLQEAYRINEHIRSLHTYLGSIRRSYLSDVSGRRKGGEPGLSDKDKDAVDASSRSLLRDLTASVTQLASAATVRHETSARQLAAKYKGSFLGKWAAGHAGKEDAQLREEGELSTERQVQESIVWYLSKRIERAGELQRSMMERRVEREIEKQRSMLYKVRGTVDFPESTSQIPTISERQQSEQHLTPEQLQVFAEENQDMLRRYEDTLDHVRTAERSMLEISELQSQLVQNLDIQSENISQLVSDSLSTSDNVSGGNRELKKASERRSVARLVFWSTCGLCGFLITWDLVF